MSFPNRMLERARVFAPLACVWLVAYSVLIFQPGGLFRFTWIKVVWLLIAVGVGALAPAGGKLPLSIRRTLCAAVVVLAASMAFSANPLASFLGRWPRFEGALVITLYVTSFALGAKVLGGGSGRRNWAAFRAGLAPALVIVALLSALEAAGFRPLGGGADLRPGATLGNATDQGIIGVLGAAVLALPALRSGPGSWLARAGLAAAVLTTVLSGSRAALLGLAAVVVLLTLALARASRATSSRILCIGAGTLVLLAAATFAIPTARERLFTAGTVHGRWLLWDESVKLVADHPWTGVGPSGFVDAITGYHTLEWAARVGNTFPPDSPHSWVLQVSSAGGLPLLLGVALAAYFVLRSGSGNLRTSDVRADRDNLTGALAAVVAYGLILLTGFTSPATTPLAALICGGLVSTTTATLANDVRRGAKAASPARCAGWPAASAAGVGLLAVLGLGVAVPAAIAEWPMAAAASAVAAGDLQAADGQFRRASALRPWDSDTALLAAQAFAGPAADGDAAAARHAIDWARVALARTPGSSEAGLALAIGYINSGHLQQGKDTLDSVITRSPSDAAPYLQRGVAKYALGDVTGSIADLAAASERSPDSPEPWTILSRIYDRLGDAGAAANAQARANAVRAG